MFKYRDVRVDAFDGVVQLGGFVNSDEQKERAAQLSQNVEGVRQVLNNIALKPQPQYMTPTGSPTGRRYDYDNGNPPPTTNNIPNRY
jgi:hypothetical protein